MKTKINSKVLRLHQKLIKLQIKMNRLNSNKLSLLLKLKIIKFMTIKRKMNRKINNMNQLITNIILKAKKNQKKQKYNKIYRLFKKQMSEKRSPPKSFLNLF